MAVGIRHADHVAPSIRKKLATISPTRGGLSVGIVRSRTQTMEFSFSFYIKIKGSTDIPPLMVTKIATSYSTYKIAKLQRVLLKQT
jgi:hypothetical protein